MGQGFLAVELFVGDQVLPVKNATVFIKDHEGNILRRLVTDENGHTEKIPLQAPDKNTEPHFAVYDIEIPMANGLRGVHIHDAQIFDTITSIQPIHMTPAVPGLSDGENTEEIFIPHAHGVDFDRNNGDPPDGNLTPGTPRELNAPPPDPALTPGNPTPFVAMANEVAIPEYMTVHLGSPNATARNVRVPFKEYINAMGG